MYSFFSLAIVFRVLSEKFLFKMNQIKRLTAWVSMSCISLFFEIIKINIILRNVLTMFYVEYLFSGQIRTLATFHYTMNTKPSNRARAKTNTCFNTLCHCVRNVPNMVSLAYVCDVLFIFSSIFQALKAKHGTEFAAPQTLHNIFHVQVKNVTVYMFVSIVCCRIFIWYIFQVPYSVTQKPWTYLNFFDTLSTMEPFSQRIQ